MALAAPFEDWSDLDGFDKLKVHSKGEVCEVIHPLLGHNEILLRAYFCNVSCSSLD